MIDDNMKEYANPDVQGFFVAKCPIKISIDGYVKEHPKYSTNTQIIKMDIGVAQINFKYYFMKKIFEFMEGDKNSKVIQLNTNKEQQVPPDNQDYLQKIEISAKDI